MERRLASNHNGLHGIVFELPGINGMVHYPPYFAEVCSQLAALQKSHPHLEIKFIWKKESLTAKQLPARFWAFSAKPIGYYLIGRAVSDALLKTALGLIYGSEQKLT